MGIGAQARRWVGGARRARRVGDAMTCAVFTVCPGATLRDAANVLRTRGVWAVPVVDADRVALYVLTRGEIRDVARRLGRTPELIVIGARRADVLYALAPHQSLAYARRLLRAAHLRSVPVLDGAGRVVGILSRRDLARDAPSFRERIAAALGVPHALCRDLT